MLLRRVVHKTKWGVPVYGYETYELGSFSKAAQELYITQQGLNKSIQQLEKEMNTQLFVRTPQGLIPTVEGQRLRKQAEPFLGQWSDILEYVTRPKQSPDNILRIGFDIGMMELVPPDFFPEYLVRHPQEEIRLQSVVSECRRMLLDNELDIAFCEAPVDTGVFLDIAVEYRPISLIVHRENPLSQKDIVTIADLRGQRLIDFHKTAPAQQYYHELCRAEGVEPAIWLNASQAVPMLELVRKNAAVSFFGGDAHWLPEELCLVPLADIHVSSGYHMIAKKGRYFSRLVRNFVKEYCQAIGYEDIPREFLE